MKLTLLITSLVASLLFVTTRSHACDPPKQGTSIVDIQDAITQTQLHMDTNATYLKAISGNAADSVNLQTVAENFTVINLTSKLGMDGDCAALNLTLNTDFYIKDIASGKLCLFNTKIELNRFGNTQNIKHSRPSLKRCY